MDCPCFFCQNPTTLGADGTACLPIRVRAQHDEAGFVSAVMHRYRENDRLQHVMFVLWKDPFGDSMILNVTFKIEKGLPKAIHPPHQKHLLDALGRPLEWTVNVKQRSADQNEIVPLRSVELEDRELRDRDVIDVQMMLGCECTAHRRAGVRPMSPAAQANGRPAAKRRSEAATKKPSKGQKQAPACAAADDDDAADRARERANFAWRPTDDASTWITKNVIRYMSIFNEHVECVSFSNPRLAPYPRQHLVDFDTVLVHPITGQHITVVTHEVDIMTLKSLRTVYERQVANDTDFDNRVRRVKLRTVGFN